MDYKKIIAYILLVNYGVCQLNVRLDADKPKLLEYTNISMTCSRQFTNGFPFAIFTNSSDNSRMVVSFLDNSCQSATEGLTWPMYSFQCHNDSTFTLTLINVTNELHGKYWRCWQRDNALVDHYSNLIDLFVQVPVRNVKISLISGNWTNQQSYIQGETLSMKCETSLGRPQPNVTWFVGESYQNASEISSSQTQYRTYNQSETLNFTISVITLNVSLAFYQKKIFCNSTNLPELEPVSSDFTLLYVEYPPTIWQMLNESIIEGQNLSKICPVDYGNPAETSVLWTNADGFSLSTTEHLILLNVLRNNGTYYTCLANNTMIHSNGTKIYGIARKIFYLNVLYRPENLTVNLSMNSEILFNITQNFSIIENSYLVFTCSATGNPEPRLFSWTGLVANNSNLLQFNATRNFTGQVTCHANNTMESTSGIKTIGHSSVTYELEILYHPAIEALSMSKVIEGEDFIKTCRISSGKTTTQTMFWTWNNVTAGINSAYLIFPKITRNMTAKYTCNVIYAIIPTYGENRTGHSNTSFYLDVLYKPENMTLRMSMETNQQFNITDNFSIIENSSVMFYCYASGNPEPKQFSWSGLGIQSSNSERLQLKVTRQFTGPITCHAKNIMEHSNGTNITGHASVTYDMDILYPPELRNEPAIREPEGRNVTLHCLMGQGKTTYHTVRWTKNGVVVWNGDSFTISNVTILHSGNYTCEVDYYMEPSYGERSHGMLKQEIYLEVVGQSSATKTDSNISTVGAVIGGAVGGAVGGLLIAVVSIASIVYYRKIRTVKSPETPVYQNMKTQDMSSLNDGFANVYEQLQDTGSNSDLQYQQLSSLVREENTGQPKVYENLRLTKKSEELNVENSSGQSEKVLPNKIMQTIV